MFKRLSAFFLDIVEVLVFSVGIFFFVYLLIMRPHKIKGASMTPTFPDGEYLFTQKVSYYRSNPQRGDVVVFKPPVSEDEYIKRVIGLPGETIVIKNCHIYINGEELKESYISQEVCTQGSSFLVDNIPYEIPEGKYIVIGDNRAGSYDSRAWGPITKETITSPLGSGGKAWIIYWPPEEAGVIKGPTY